MAVVPTAPWPPGASVPVPPLSSGVARAYAPVDRTPPVKLNVLVPVPAPAPGIVETIRELDRDPDRLARARAAAVTTFLRRHDWAHRWREVLALVGMDEPPQLAERLDRLEVRRRAWEAREPSLGLGLGVGGG